MNFHGLAFVENLPLREVADAFPEARRSVHELVWTPREGSAVFLYPFGALVFQNLSPEEEERELARVREARPGLAGPVGQGEITVREGAGPVGLKDGVLCLDRLTADRAGIVALTVAQSAAMEYYERVIDDLFTRTDVLVERLERRGTVPLRTKPLHRFIGAAVGARNEVLSVLHLLDKPDATWDDAAMDAIYADLKDEFDLGDRYHALEHKLRSLQESLELVLDVARDRRLVFLEMTIVILILVEIVMSLFRAH